MALSGDYIEKFMNQSTPDVIGFCLAIPIELLGESIVYAWTVFLMVGMVGLKSRRAGVAGFGLLILTSASIGSLPVEMHGLLIILLGAAFGLAVYTIATKE